MFSRRSGIFVIIWLIAEGAVHAGHGYYRQDLIMTVCKGYGLTEQKPPRTNALGKKMFHDPRLSRDGQTSCQSCHDSSGYFSRNGAPSPSGFLDPPTLINVANRRLLGHDGHSAALPVYVLHPLLSPREQNLDPAKLVDLVCKYYPMACPEKPKAAAACLPWTNATPMTDSDALRMIGATVDPLTRRQLAGLPATMGAKDAISLIWKNYLPTTYDARDRSLNEANCKELLAAIAPLTEYVAAITARKSKFDQFRDKACASQEHVVRNNILTRDQQRGMELFFGKAKCHVCHRGNDLTDDGFHNLGLPSIDASNPPSLGRSLGIFIEDSFAITADKLASMAEYQAYIKPDYLREKIFLDRQSPLFLGATRTPTLRNVSRTAPYMHDGRFPDLDSVLGFYTRGGDAPPVGEKEGTITPLFLTSEEHDWLLKFLLAL